MWTRVLASLTPLIRKELLWQSWFLWSQIIRSWTYPFPFRSCFWASYSQRYGSRISSSNSFHYRLCPGWLSQQYSSILLIFLHYSGWESTFLRSYSTDVWHVLIAKTFLSLVTQIIWDKSWRFCLQIHRCPFHPFCICAVASWGIWALALRRISVGRNKFCQFYNQINKYLKAPNLNVGKILKVLRNRNNIS